MSLSFSQLSLYQRCPRQYEFACIKKLPRPISAGESFGSSVHNTLAKWGRLEMENGPHFAEATRGRELRIGNDEGQIPLFIDEVKTETVNCPLFTVNSLLQHWHSSFIVEGYASKVDADKARERGEKLMERFYEWWSTSERNVVGVEQGFSVVVGSTEGNEGKEGREGGELAGRFDRVEEVEGGLKVIDFKTSTVRSQEEVDRDLQLSVYALACEKTFGKPCTGLSFLFLSEGEAREITTTRNEQQLDDARSQIRLMSDRISEKDFAPDPSIEKCTQCPYRGVCDAAQLQ